ncbi:MAG: hypothetical protein HC767_12725 [Akkermansiaceae bacterium]|nr:hypothetical protein [Akkermansiaceae bacterium]
MMCASTRSSITSGCSGNEAKAERGRRRRRNDVRRALADFGAFEALEVQGRKEDALSERGVLHFGFGKTECPTKFVVDRRHRGDAGDELFAGYPTLIAHRTRYTHCILRGLVGVRK